MEQSTKIQRFLEWGQRQVSQDNREVLSHLRRGFTPGTESYCWPFIAHYCNLSRSRDRQIWTLIAAGFALHGRSLPCGNMGTTLKNLALEGNSGKTEDALNSFDPRFRRLLSADLETVCRLLGPLIRMAKARNQIPVDFECLYNDLRYWGEKVKLRWVQSYWTGDENTST